MSTKTVMLIGRSGCGKGTQAKLLEEYLKKTTGKEVIYISTGDKMREVMRIGNATSRLIDEKIMRSGELAPYALAIWAWLDVFIRQDLNHDKHLILDGTPRTKEEAKIMINTLEWYERSEVYPLLLQVSAAEATRRMFARGRADDIEQNIKNRLEFYEDQVVPALGVLGRRYGLMGVAAERASTIVHCEILELIGV